MEYSYKYPAMSKSYSYSPRIVFDKGGRILYKNGGVWENIGAGTFGVVEGVANSLTMGQSAGAFDTLYGNIDKKGEYEEARGYGRVGGAVGTAVVTGGASAKGSALEGARGLGQGLSETGERTGDGNIDFAGDLFSIGGQYGGLAFPTQQGVPVQGEGLPQFKKGGKIKKYEYGGNTDMGQPITNKPTEYEGNVHEDGGIPIGVNYEVEDGEFKYKDMIFSNSINYEEKKK